MGTVVRRRPGVGGEVCLRTPPPPGGYDYSRYPSNFPHPVGNQPPIHAADPRKRCQNCNELGHVHQYCAWRIDPGQSRPPPPHLHVRRVHPQGSVDSRHGKTLTVKLILPPPPFKGMHRLPMCLTLPPPTLMRQHKIYDNDYGDYYYEQPAPEDYGYVDHQYMPTPPLQYQQPPDYYNYAQHQHPPPPPQTQQPPSIHAPFPSSSPPPGASAPPPSQLHLLTARSVPQGESELNPVVFGRVGCAGLALASQPPREAVGERTVGPVGSELWVSDNGATNHITNDPTNVYDWEAISPGKEKVLIGDGK